MEPLDDVNWGYAVQCEVDFPGPHAPNDFFAPTNHPQVPVFVTEWAFDGTGLSSLEEWLANNRIPNCSRAIANARDEGGALGYFLPGNTNFTGPWSDHPPQLSTAGRYLIDFFTLGWAGNSQGEAFMFTAPCAMEAERVASNLNAVCVTDDVGGGAHVLGGKCDLSLYVPEPGAYKVTYRVKSLSGINSIELSTSPITHPPLPMIPNVIGTILEPATGAWSAWTDVEHEVTLPGLCTLYVNANTSSPGLALNRFMITPLHPRTPPTMSAMADQYVVSGSELPGLLFSVGDELTPPVSLVVTATTSNSTLLPLSGIQVLAGLDGQRVLLLDPVAGQSGQATVTLVVADTDGLRSQTDFTLIVMPRYPQVDANADGISDIWAARYAMVGAPADDPDGDGQSNRQEAEAGTDPNRAESVLANSLGRKDDGSLWLSWGPYTSAKQYRIETSSDFEVWTVQEPPDWMLLPEQPLDIEGTTVSAQVSPAGGAAASSQFWRVTAQDFSKDASGVNEWEKRQSDLLATLVATSGPNGRISPSGSRYMVKGTSVTYAIVPDSGYCVDQVTVDGVAVGAVSSYTFAGVGAGAHTIHVTFKLVAPVNVALNHPVTASSSEAGYPPSNAVDGSLNTRWSSTFSDPQWIMVDLGSICNISRIELVWETAFARSYSLQTSPDKVTWEDVALIPNGDGGTDIINCGIGARYVRLYSTHRGTQWGVSLYEFVIIGTPGNEVPRVDPGPIK